MRRRGLLALALVACAGCATWLGVGEDSRLAVWVASAQADRGLELREPVRLELISQEAVPELLREELEAAVPREQTARLRDAYAALGVLPPDFDLFEAQLELHKQAIAGLYSPRRRTLFVLEGEAASATIDAIAVHEVVHALQHQHFADTVELMMALRRNDVVQLAIASELEGDATLTMLAGTPLTRAPSAAAPMEKAMRAELAKPSPETAHLPLLLRASLYFPYGAGTVYAAQRYAEAQNPGLDAALRNPPLATALVLDPASRAPVEFVRLPAAALAARLAPRECSAGEDNVAGAFTLDVLFATALEQAEREALARVWRGDRFVHLDCGEKWELVWLTRWDSPESAERFARAYAKVAAAVGANAPLSGAPVALVRDRTVLVITPGARAHADWLLAASEIRTYTDFLAWRADGCFPETPCPTSPEGE
jgi:hypothetical protein